ncbi:MAG TPA: hypothetical protein VJ373_08390, partial [Desulfatiglandales bacterium]|nr:hypothetical protein [Desulfatiglandales bacterium]
IDKIIQKDGNPSFFYCHLFLHVIYSAAIIHRHIDNEYIHQPLAIACQGNKSYRKILKGVKNGSR